MITIIMVVFLYHTLGCAFALAEATHWRPQQGKRPHFYILVLRFPIYALKLIPTILNSLKNGFGR